MGVHLNSSISVCIWLIKSSYSYFIDLLYTFSREIFSYLAFVKKHTQISFWNGASNAFKLVNKIYTDKVQNNWVEKCIHKIEENYVCLEIRRKKSPILYANAENITVFELELRFLWPASFLDKSLIIVIIILFHRTKRHLSFRPCVIKRPCPTPTQIMRQFELELIDEKDCEKKEYYLTHCDTEHWMVMFVGMYQDLQKLNVLFSVSSKGILGPTTSAC